MKFKRLLLVSLVILTPVFADQFAYLRPEVAKRAAAMLTTESEIYLFCEPCGEPKGQVEKVLKVDTADVNYEGLHEVRVNNKGIDLAYVFVKRGTKWKNVAVMLGMRPYAVSGELPVSVPGQPLPGY